MLNMEELKSTYLADLGLVKDDEQLSAFWQKYFGKGGSIQGLMKEMKNVPKEEKPAFGKMVNEVKEIIKKNNKVKAIDLNKAQELKMLKFEEMFDEVI